MKKFFIKCIAGLMAAVMLFGISVSATENTEPNTENGESTKTGETVSLTEQGFALTLQNENYSFYYKAQTAETAVTDNKSGYTWYSNPQNSSAGINKAQVIVYYYEKQDIQNLDSYNACVYLENEIKTSVEGNKFTVSYQIGDSAFDSDILPRVLTKERMENDILPKLSEEDKAKVLKRYTLYSKESLDQSVIDSIKLTFPSIEKYDIYVRKNIPGDIAKGIYEIFQKAGYTLEDLQRDCDENGIENTYKEKPYFNLDLVYVLNEDGITVELDPEKMEYRQDVKPCRIDLLPYFGAQGTEETGFMFVPDGCGAIINLNNGKTAATRYWKKFFNHDGALSLNETPANNVESLLPVFAMSLEGGSFLATIDSGYESAGISADTAKEEGSYNYIHPFFDLFATDKVSLSNNSLDTFILSGQKIFSEKIAVSYHLGDANADYTQLALIYRDYLTENKILNSNTEPDLAELNVDFIGTAKVKKRFLGIPYETFAALTEYEQAAEILESLSAEKIDVNYKNALKGGAKQQKADQIKLQSVLGSKKELKALRENVNSLSVSYYAQRAVSLSKKNSAINLSSSTAKISSYNIISRYINSGDYMKLLSSSKLESFAKKVTKSLKSSKIESVNILDLGYELNSDFNENNSLDRADARRNIQAYLETIAKSAKVTVEKGSIFSLPYINKIKNIPVCSSGYLIEDATVPFYQIAVSGLVSYATPAINESEDARKAFLKTVELGGQLQYIWIYELPENISDSYEDYYKYLYKNTVKQAQEYSKEYLPLYNKIKGQSIMSHKQIADSVFETQYENGVSVLVNYSDTDAVINGVTVKAVGFAVME